jgi:hypothetical protein
MMKNRIAVYLAVVALTFVSCRTTLNYPAIAPNSPNNFSGSIINGYFVSEKNSPNDIIIQQISFRGFNIPSLTDATNEINAWSGKIIVGDKENAIKIRIHLSRFKTNEHTLGYVGPEKPWAMYVTPKELPEDIKIKRFKLSNGQEILFKENSREFSRFSVNGVVFSAAVGEGKEYSKLSVLQSGEAQLYIINSAGVVYADFDMDSYRIYRADDSIALEQLQLIVAVFSIIQHLVVVL